jgi:hypothetical protein
MFHKKTNWDRNTKKKKTIGKFWNFPLVENMVSLIGNFNKKRPHLNIEKPFVVLDKLFLTCPL